MVLTRFSWPHGGRQVFLCGSFSRWTEHYRMTLVEGSSTMFQTICNLPPGIHQYRFLVDGVWRIDERQLCLNDDYGMVNNVIFIEPDVSASMLHHPRTMEVDDGIALYTASSSSHLPQELMAWISDTDLEISRQWVSRLLSNRTLYDILPASSKVTIMDIELPVKQAFHIMYEEGLAVVPLWDDCRKTLTGMLTASDFILILKELQSNVRMLADEELEMHSISAWKEEKAHLYRISNGPIGMRARPLIQVSDLDCLRDVALKIVQHEISAVPVLRSSLQDELYNPLLNLASLHGILKYICSHFVEPLALLQHPICRIPVGTWLPGTGRHSDRQLAVLQLNASLRSALDLLLEARISSIPIVDANGSLIDVYSRSDIMALAKDDTYSCIQVDQMTMEQALNQANQANLQSYGSSRRCRTCFPSTSFREVMEQLSDPGARRIIVIDARSRRVEGIISLRDMFTFLLG